MPILSALILLAVGVSPLAAEVCDKIAGDGWSPDQGPINVLNRQVALKFGVAFAAATVLIRIFRSRRLAWTAAILSATLMVVVAFSATGVLGDDSMTEAALREGCLTDISMWSVAMRALSLAMAAVFFIWTARGRTLNG